MIARRGFLTGLASMLAAPAIVHAGNLMPVKVVKATFDPAAVAAKLWDVSTEGGYLYSELLADVLRNANSFARYCNENDAARFERIEPHAFYEVVSRR